jgi:phospholipid/cholesterol/gamma-HCH transport system substrate-binding protein
MKKAQMELSVGFFVLLGVLAVAYLAVNLGEVEIWGKDYYTLKARFSSVSGLNDGARVEISGVPVGKVEGITLDPQTLAAVVRLRVRSDLKLTNDAIASISTSGLIGEKYVKISPGAGDQVLADGGFITETEPAVNLGELIGKYVFGNVQDKK